MSDWILWDNELATAAVRTGIVFLIGIVTALRWRGYVAEHPTPPLAPILGQTLVLAGLLWAQARQLNHSSTDTNPSTVLFLVGLLLILWALLGSMKIHLFHQDGWTVSPSGAEMSRQATSDEVDRIGKAVDRVEEAVNNRHGGQTMSEQVKSMADDLTTARLRDEAADAAVATGAPSPKGAADVAAAATADGNGEDEEVPDE